MLILLAVAITYTMHINPNGKTTRTPEPDPSPSTSSSMKVTAATNVMDQPETTPKTNDSKIATTGALVSSTFSRFFSSTKEALAEIELKAVCATKKLDYTDYIFVLGKDKNGKATKTLTKKPEAINKEIAKIKVEEIKEIIITQMDVVTAEHSKDNHIEAAISTMSDSPEAQNHLRAQLHNPVFSSSAFTGFTESSSSSLFVACFGEHCLEFSNRASSSEIRGQILKSMLSQSTYNTLYELLVSTFCSTLDPIVLCALSPVRAELQLLNDEDGDDAEEILNLVLAQLKNVDFVGRQLCEYMPTVFSSSSDNKNK